jgi:hypothetical protein
MSVAVAVGLVGDEGVSVGVSGLGWETVHAAANRLRPRNDAKNLFMISFQLKNPMFFAEPVQESGRQYR